MLFPCLTTQCHQLTWMSSTGDLGEGQQGRPAPPLVPSVTINSWGSLHIGGRQGPSSASQQNTSFLPLPLPIAPPATQVASHIFRGHFLYTVGH